MKKLFASIILLMITCICYAQESRITLSGGYSFGKVEAVEAQATGWRINGLYEFNPMQGNAAHGLSIGYLHVSGVGDGDDVTYDINTIPVYYAPKFMFGGEKLKGFIKGAIGWQISKLKTDIDGGLFEDKDSGFTAGLGAGALYSLNEKLLLNLEYEFLWLSNSFYRNESINTVSLGLGYKF